MSWVVLSQSAAFSEIKDNPIKGKVGKSLLAVSLYQAGISERPYILKECR